MKNYIIPTEWRMVSRVTVKANSLEEAIEKVKNEKYDFAEEERNAEMSKYSWDVDIDYDEMEDENEYISEEDNK